MCIAVDIIGFRNFGLNTCANARKYTGHICSPIITLASHCLWFKTMLQQTDEEQLDALDGRRKGLCETRWSSRADALNIFKSAHALIIDTLDDLGTDTFCFSASFAMSWYNSCQTLSSCLIFRRFEITTCLPYTRKRTSGFYVICRRPAR
jgi:hypothetical protein